jgi:hypothetical protein
MCGGRGSVTSGLAILSVLFDGGAREESFGFSAIRCVGMFVHLLGKDAMISVSQYD